MKPLPISRKHHYIPICYSKGFTNAEGAFYVYDKKLDKIWFSNPVQTFYEKNRNIAADPTIETNEIIENDFPETALTEHDTKAAPVLQAIRESSPEDAVLTIENLYRLRMFMFSLFWRSPANDDFRNDFINKNSYQSMGMRFLNELTGIPDEQAEEIILNSNTLRQLYPYILPLITFENGGDNQNFGDWKLLYQKDSFHLITDNPIIHSPVADFSALHKNVIFHVSGNITIVSTNKRVPQILPSVFSLRIDILMFIRAQRFVACSNRKYLDWIIAHTKKHLNDDGWALRLSDQIFGEFI